MKTASLEAVNLINVTSTQKTSTKETNEQGSFRDVMDKVSNTGNTKENETKQSTDKDLVQNNGNKADVDETKVKETSLQEKEPEQQDVIQSDNKTNSILEDKINLNNPLDELSDKIKKILLESLQISEEELQAAMQVLGINYLDCMDKNQLASLLADITGNGDSLSLITNESLYQQFSDIVSVMDDLKKDVLANFSLTSEELTTMMEQAKVANNSKSTVAVETAQDSASLNQQSDINVIKAVKDDAAPKPFEQVVTVKVDEDKLVKADSATLNENKTETVPTKTQNNEQQSDFDDSKQKKALQAKDNANETYQKYALNQDVVSNETDDLVVLNEKKVINTENLFKQIESQIKLSTRLDTTKMEFQLNPAHLGKLTIELASKDGLITAQIKAQNAVVKEVIESQIVQLKENMNQQGLKVEAVEVTVETHEFERNLEQENSNTNQEQYEQQQKKSRRQLNLHDPESLEDLSADEALVADMMIGNGNSLNYTV